VTLRGPFLPDLDVGSDEKDALMTATDGGRIVSGAMAPYRSMTTRDGTKVPALRFPSGRVLYPSQMSLAAPDAALATYS
jgi:hypothetical protein